MTVSENTMVWPDGAKCAVMISFDFDAETLWMSRNPDAEKFPAMLSQGTYGAAVGIPKLLELLGDLSVPATFFTPGWTAERHPGRVADILEAGHEIGHHGYLHKWVDPDDPEGEVEELDRGLAALESSVGHRPTGYRPPAAVISPRTVELVHERGLIYLSAMLDRINPYRHVLPDGSPGPVEIPFQWNLDDSAIALYSLQTPRPIFPSSHILEVWKEEFEALYEWGALCDIVLHPQISGRPARLKLLRRFIEYMQSYPGVWFATGTEIANLCMARDGSEA